MTTTPSDVVLRHLRGLAARHDDPTPDGQLLRRFAATRDETAFQALLRRHGPMVLGVCRRVLRHEQDAEDAFQATFLVLARKAVSVRCGPSLAPWLHGVARRVALNARAEAARASPAPIAEVAASAADPAGELTWREVRGALDEELARLPEKYRAPLVLCYLEGLARDEAAARLGCPLGTLKGRLERGRDLLRQRLTRRGLGLAAALAVLAVERTAVPSALAVTTARAAAGFAAGVPGTSVAVALAEAALRDLAGTKLRAVAALLLGLMVLAIGTELLVQPVPMPTPPVAEAEPPQRGRAAAESKVKADAQGDPLPAGAVARLGTLRWRHEGEAEHLAFSPDGKMVAATSQAGIIVFWDAATGKVLRRYRPAPDRGQRQVGPLAFSPDGKVLAWQDYQGVHLWDLSADKEVRCLVRPIRELAGDRHILRFSPDGKLLAWRGNSRTIVWEAASGKELVALGRIDACPQDLAFSPDSKVLVEATYKPSVQLWDVATGQLIRDIDAHFSAEGAGAQPAFADAVAFSPDGKQLASAGRDAIVISEVASGKELARWKQKQYILGLAFTPDGKTLVSGETENAKIRGWDVATGRERFVLDRGMFIGRSMALSPDGKTVAMGGPYNIVHLWDVSTGKGLFPEPEGHDAAVRTVAFSPDGKLLASGGENRHIHLWDAADGRHVRRLKGSRASVVSFSPDGKRLATGWMWNATARVWDLDRGEELVQMAHDDTDKVEAVAFSADGKTLVTVSPEKGTDGVKWLRAWDAATGKPLREMSLRGPHAQFRALAPDGRTAALAGPSGGRSATVYLCDLERGKVLLSCPGHRSGVVCAAFSPDGQVLASGGVHDDQTVRLWEVVSGQEIAMLKGHERTVSAITFSPDGRVVVSGEGSDTYAVSFGRGSVQPTGPHRIHFWDSATGQELATLQGHDSDVTSLALSPDGKRLASGLYNGTVLLWDVPARTKAPPPSKDLSAKDFDALWADLAGDAGKAHRTARALAAVPGQAVPFLKERLRPAEEMDPKKFRQWLADLDADEFGKRDAAANALLRLGSQAEPELRKALAAKPSAEMKRHIEAILAAMQAPPSGELLRSLRAMRALEAAGTAEARQLLESLAKGEPAARQTVEAKAALERLARRNP